MGYEIVFLLYAFEGPWYWGSQPDLISEMREQWPDVRIIYSNRQVGQPPKDGDIHRLDEWWDPVIGDTLSRTFEYEDFDICVVHNVWLTKAFDFVPDRVVKILDAHDLFFQRLQIFREYGVLDRFFLIDEQSELVGIRRANISVTIKAEDEVVVNRLDKNISVITLPYASSSGNAQRVNDRNINYLNDDKVVFGFLGGPHAYNISGLVDLINRLNEVISDTFAPIELIIAGGVCGAIADKISTHSFQPKLLGHVENEQDFYNSVDIAIAPVFFGTGFKVKVAEILSIRKPLICAKHAAEGALLHNFVVCDSPINFAKRMADVAFDRIDLTVFSSISADSDNRLNQSVLDGELMLARRIQVFHRSIRAVLPHDEWNARTAVRLISHVLHSRVIRSHWNYVIQIDESSKIDISDLNRLAQPGLEFESDNENRTDQILIIDEMDSSSAAPQLELQGSKTVLDLRFRKSGRLPEYDFHFQNYFTNHAQAHLMRDAIPGCEVFPAPMLNDAIRWDPCVRHLIGRIYSRNFVDVRGNNSIILCPSEMVASLAKLTFDKLVLIAPRVIVAENNLDFNNYLFYLLSCASGCRAWEGEVEVVFLEGIDTWIISIIEEIAQYSSGCLKVRSIEDILALEDGVFCPDGPVHKASFSGMYWNVSGRLLPN